eukprot:6156681-Amphidinium_carterae.1
MEPTNTQVAGYWTPYTGWAKPSMDKSAPKQWGAGHQAPCTRCSIGRRIGSGHRPPMATMKA